MNFFEQQDRARRQSKWLIALFVLALISIAAALGFLAFLLAGWPLVPYASGGVLIIMLLASLVKTLGLRQGGGKVARAMQGTQVDPNTHDPLRRRLYRVVEEMAIASGVPVPEVYVLEHEAGINAFAAGYTPNDAAVAVTRGLLEQLSRDELQGVIAHEFSHIVNGDMRINIRLMGFVFGIMVIALMGQQMMHSARFSKNSKDAAPLIMLSLVIVLIGYIGLFFGRLIKAAISRQREYLADAAAVQFTRNPAGISGALKKIGVAQAGGELSFDAEEVGHMLFGQSHRAWLLATHPPLIKRIQAIEPDFTEEGFKALSESMARREQAAVSSLTESETTRQSFFEAKAELDWPGWIAAAALLTEIPNGVQEAAHSDELIEAFFIYLLAGDQWLGANALSGLVTDRLGEPVTQAVQTLLDQWGVLPATWRLPLFEMALPTLRRRPIEDLKKLQSLAAELIHEDGRISVFEYALDRLLSQSIDALVAPAKTQLVGHATLQSRAGAVSQVLHIVASQGHGSKAEQQSAYDAVMQALLSDGFKDITVTDWSACLDDAIKALNQLNAQSKSKLAEAMIECIAWDGQVSAEEYALVRAIAALLHVPLPIELDAFLHR